MTWHGVLGHDHVFQWFQRAIAQGRLASTFLFVGPSGIGKRLTALRLAQALQCETYPETELQACGRCASCQQVLSGNHPDVELVSRPEDRTSIPVELFIGEREHRLREGLCHTISLKPTLGRRRIAIIDDADYLNDASANCLLKTLEEPPPRAILILIGTSQQQQLPTIRSRCQIVRFAPLEPDVLAQLIRRGDPQLPDEEVRRLAALSGGSLDRVRELNDEEMRAFREQLLTALAAPQLPSVDLAKSTNAFIEDLGKEAPPRRARTRQIVAIAIEFYVQLLHKLVGETVTGDESLVAAIERAAGHWQDGDERAAACVERCLETLLQIDQNAHLTTAVDCWLDDLAELAVGRLSRSAAAW